MKKLYVTFLLTFALASDLPSQTNITVDITTDTVWDLAGSPYILLNRTAVLKDATLTIKAGVVVRLETSVNLIVNGALVARGQKNNPIIFTSNQANPSPGDWGAVGIEATNSSSSIIEYTNFSYGLAGVSITESSPTIRNCVMRQTLFGGVRVDGGSPLIENNNIYSNADASIFVGIGSPIIRNNTLHDNDQDGIFVGSPGSPIIHNNVIFGNRRYGINASTGCLVFNNTIDGNETAINCDNKSPQVFNNIVTNHSDVGIRAVNGGIPRISYNDIWNNNRDYFGISPGTGDISSNPRFLDEANRDYRLQQNSPCIDTGDPNSPLDPDGTRADMGALPFLRVAQLPHELVLLADSEIKVTRPRNSEGDIHSNGDITFKKGKESEHTGNLTAVDDIELGKKNTIIGDVTAGEEVKSDGTVTGNITEDASVAFVPLPELSFEAQGEDIELDKGENLTIPPDSYSNVKVKKKAELALSTGEYFMEKLELGKETILIIDISSGAVTINVEDKLEFGKEAEVQILPGGEDGSRFVTFNFEHDKQVEIGKKAKILGNIIAPDASVKLGKNVRFKGVICAKEILVKKRATFLPHGSNTSLPKVLTDLILPDSELLTESIPTRFELSQNFPNPFNPSTTINFALPKAGEVRLKIYNLRGQLIAALQDGVMVAGQHRMVWDGRDARGLRVASGIYVYRLETAGFVATKKLTVLR